MICALNFLTAVSWGQLSKCQKISYSVDHYSCSNRVAYGSVCAFAVLLFLVQFAFSIASILWRGDLISEVGLYDDISAGSGATYLPTRYACLYHHSLDSSHPSLIISIYLSNALRMHR